MDDLGKKFVDKIDLQRAFIKACMMEPILKQMVLDNPTVMSSMLLILDMTWKYLDENMVCQGDGLLPN